MGEKRMLPVVPAESEDERDSAGAPRGVSRRAALQSIAAGVGAGFALPVTGEAAHPVERHLGHAQQPRPAAKADTKGGKAPEFLDAHQFATLSVLAELIVPGAKASASDTFIDHVLAVESTDNQRRFISALGALDGAAIARHKRPFKDLAANEQVKFLEDVSTQKSGVPETPPWSPGAAVTPPAPTPVTLTLRDHFDHIKGWVSGAHYSSEAGMKELGWTGMAFFPSYPGCTHPGGHK
jgi:Gluconate 2-dehydrogenase subunit 3